MGTTELVNAVRTTKRGRRLGPDAACDHCGWTDTTALTKTSDGQIRCYECRSSEQGRSVIEAHHHLGRANDRATIPVPGNLHRDLSERQRDWPDRVRSNPQRDPLLWLAAAFLGLRDHLAWWTSWLERIAQWLVQLAETLRTREGERWWDAMSLPPLWQASP